MTANNRRFDVVIFDLDGTLADTLPLIYLAFEAALQPMTGAKPTHEEIRGLFGPPDNHVLRDLSPDDQGRAAIDRYKQIYSEFHDSHVKVFDGMRELLQEARSGGSLLGVVTGKSRDTAIETLEKTGLIDFFDVVYAGDDVERQKPDPEALVLALKDLGYRPEQSAVIVGDSAADVGAGKAASIATIGVMWGVPEKKEMLAEQPDFVVKDVFELREVLGIAPASPRGFR